MQQNEGRLFVPLGCFAKISRRSTSSYMKNAFSLRNIRLRNWVGLNFQEFGVTLRKRSLTLVSASNKHCLLTKFEIKNLVQSYETWVQSILLRRRKLNFTAWLGLLLPWKAIDNTVGIFFVFNRVQCTMNPSILRNRVSQFSLTKCWWRSSRINFLILVKVRAGRWLMVVDVIRTIISFFDKLFLLICRSALNILIMSMIHAGQCEVAWFS